MPEDDPSSAGSFRYARDADFYCLAEGDGEGSRSSVMAEICCGRMEHEVRDLGCRSIEDVDTIISNVDAFTSEVRDYLSVPGHPSAPGVGLAAMILDRQRCRAIVGCSGSAAVLLPRGGGAPLR